MCHIGERTTVQAGDDLDLQACFFDELEYEVRNAHAHRLKLR